MIEKTIFPSDYGIAFLSVDLFMEEIKKKKCKARKFISYFNKHMDVYFELIEQGILVPFHPVNAGTVPLFIETENQVFQCPKGYQKIFQYDDFYLQVGAQGIVTLASFGHLEYQGKEIARGETKRSYFDLDGHEDFSAIDFPLEKGEYQFSMIGLEKIERTDFELRYDCGYAYGFQFIKSANVIKDNLEKCDDDYYDFRLMSKSQKEK
ncbi:MAG: hypothetical protein KHZ15_02565 [Coprobacillus cateniformis]|uniref:hypothetical protein n=1 Tax=Longibaculum muris TaxID=1796628 RepID=UPI003AB681C9|nr:hypothetical protein [Coprobacillus cateniformis]